MKISVVMLSRGRPAAMVGSVMSLWRLRASEEPIDVVVGMDTDDQDARLGCETLASELRLGSFQPWFRARAEVRGSTENVLIGTASGDVILLYSDRAFCITPGWDEVIAKAVTQVPNRVLWWSSPQDPGCVMPIIPRAYLDANEGKWSPEIFPFWYDDTWHQEIDLMIHGLPSLKVVAMYAGARGKTQRGREFAFWQNVFTQSRKMRIEQAHKIAKMLGIPMQERKDVLEYFAKYDEIISGRSEEFEESFGDTSDPGPEYHIAKDKAVKLLEELA